MKRYFAYIVFLNMIVNVFIFVPQILIQDRFRGSVTAVLVSVPIGMALMYAFLKSMSKFPEKGLPYILDTLFPRWISRIMCILFASIIMSAGMITMLSIADTSIRYINPDTPFPIGVFMFLIVVCMAASHRTKQVLFLIEMILLLDVPLILFIIVKAYWNNSYNWDAVGAVAMSFNHPPTWTSLSAATYIFSAYTNQIVFNKSFKQPVSPRWVWFFGPIGIGVLLSSFTIPIAFQGADGVSDYIYPWLITADSMRVELGFIERVLPIFLLLYASISLGSIFIHWHVALDLVRETLPTFLSQKTAVTWTIIGLFAAITFLVTFWTTEKTLSDLGNIWMQLRFIGEILLVMLVMIAALRRRRTSP